MKTWQEVDDATMRVNKPSNLSIESLRMFLISHHEDGDDGSMYMKFAEIMRYIELLEELVHHDSRVIDILIAERDKNNG